MIDKKNYKIDVINNTMLVTKGFYEATQEIGTPELNMWLEVRKMFPDIKMVVRTTKSCGRKNPYKGLTYSFMRRFIFTLDEENAVNYEKVIKHYESIYSDDTTTVYCGVREWFLEQYPNYKELIVESIPEAA